MPRKPGPPRDREMKPVWASAGTCRPWPRPRPLVPPEPKLITDWKGW